MRNTDTTVLWPFDVLYIHLRIIITVFIAVYISFYLTHSDSQPNRNFLKGT